MKIKDLPKGTSLENIKVKTPLGYEGYWRSQWGKGVFLTLTPDDTKMIPYLVKDLKECLEWEVLEVPKP